MIRIRLTNFVTMSIKIHCYFINIYCHIIIFHNIFIILLIMKSIGTKQINYMLMM